MGQHQRNGECKMIKFNKFNVTNGKEKVNVSYVLDNGIDTRKCVTILSKNSGNNLQKIFKNNIKALSFLGLNGKRKVCLFKNHPLYSQARAFVESIK